MKGAASTQSRCRTRTRRNYSDWAPTLEGKLRSIPQLQDIFSDLRLASPRLNVQIDRDRALAVGVTPEAIANTLFDAYGNRRVTTITTETNQYDVLLEVLPEYQRDPAALDRLYHPSIRTATWFRSRRWRA